MEIENMPPLILPGEKIEHLIMFGRKEVIDKRIKELEALGFKEDKGNDQS